MADALIEAAGLKVHRERRLVLEIPSVQVEAGEVLAVIGPNGSGKSTLLQALALLLPAEMTYRFGGRAVRLPDEGLALRRQMAVVFQRPLLVEGSVYDNVALGLRLRGVAEAEARTRVMAELALFGVADLAKRPARALSGGEAQRVSLARALVLRPRVLFLDEPFMALDVLTRSAILQDLRRILREAGVTALFVTHDFTEIPPLADRVAVLMSGHIVQSGTPREVFSHPADEQVQRLVRAAADLIGSLIAPLS
ncbi:MAG TPA: ATP-binding cassette domain-containing protein [Symbiobacteriaceae bacterium]|nr:ATP-binding cassette domain-containing protein [Symbiobacteriaceae bacterium]